MTHHFITFEGGLFSLPADPALLDSGCEVISPVFGRRVFWLVARDADGLWYEEICK